MAPVRIVNADGKPLTPDDLIPRAAPLALDPAQFVPHRDSFIVVFQGNALGTMVAELVKAGDSLVYRENMSMPIARWGLNTIVRLDPASLAIRSVELTGQMGVQAVESRLTYAGGRVKGRSQTPQRGTVKALDVDTTLSAGTVDVNAVNALVPALALQQGAAHTFNAYDGTDGTVKQVTATVTDAGNLTVPAGMFPVYRVEVIGAQPVALYITREAPRKIVKIERLGQPMSIELVK